MCFAGALIRQGAGSGSGRTADPIERAQLFQEIGRLAFRAGDNAAVTSYLSGSALGSCRAATALPLL